MLPEAAYANKIGWHKGQRGGDRGGGFNGQTMYRHGDWQGTDRMHTSYQGNSIGALHSGAFGENSSMSGVGAGGDDENSRFTGQDHDPETETDHFQYRQYHPTEGRWMSPDPYSGSYDPLNPQSLNRYSYVLNNPYSLTDPTGLNALCSTQSDEAGNLRINCIESDGGGGIVDQPGYGQPPRQAPDDPADPGSGNQNPSTPTATNNGIGQQIQLDPYKKRLFDTHYCGPGGDGPTVNKLDEACAAHDACYDNRGFTPFSNIDPFLDARRTKLLQDCNQRLCNATTGPAAGDRGSGLVRLYFTNIVNPGAACH